MTLSEKAMILREGQAARMITMMEVIVVAAVYLRLRPLFTSPMVPNASVRLKRLGPGTACLMTYWLLSGQVADNHTQ